MFVPVAQSEGESAAHDVNVVVVRTAGIEDTLSEVVVDTVVVVIVANCVDVGEVRQ